MPKVAIALHAWTGAPEHSTDNKRYLVFESGAKSAHTLDANASAPALNAACIPLRGAHHRIPFSQSRSSRRERQVAGGRAD